MLVVREAATTEQKQSFVARDARGREYVIVINPGTLPEWTGPGQASFETGLRTAGGMPVTRIGKGVYTLLTHGGTIRVTSDDPNAP